MKEKKNFWDRNARIYNRFMRKDRDGIRNDVCADPTEP